MHLSVPRQTMPEQAGGDDEADDATQQEHYCPSLSADEVCENKNNNEHNNYRNADRTANFFRQSLFVCHSFPPKRLARPQYHRFPKAAWSRLRPWQAWSAASYGCGRNCSTSQTAPRNARGSRPSLRTHW